MHRVVDLDGNIISCNDKYARMLGYIRDEVVGMSIFDHTPKEHRGVVRTQVPKLHKLGMWSDCAGTQHYAAVTGMAIC